MIITNQYLISRARFYSYTNWFNLYPELPKTIAIQKLRLFQPRLGPLYMPFKLYDYHK